MPSPYDIVMKTRASIYFLIAALASMQTLSPSAATHAPGKHGSSTSCAPTPRPSPKDVSVSGTVTSLAAYPRQPFDFAGRTGTIVFDVSNDSQGTHMAWPELWVTDQPVPDPFVHEGPGGQPRNGFGIRFAGCDNGSDWRTTLGRHGQRRLQ